MSIAQLCEYSASKSGALAIHETVGVELYHRCVRVGPVC
jgi:hypothetical protein